MNPISNSSSFFQRSKLYRMISFAPISDGSTAQKSRIGHPFTYPSGITTTERKQPLDETKAVRSTSVSSTDGSSNQPGPSVRDTSLNDEKPSVTSNPIVIKNGRKYF